MVAAIAQVVTQSGTQDGSSTTITQAITIGSGNPGLIVTSAVSSSSSAATAACSDGTAITGIGSSYDSVAAEKAFLFYRENNSSGARTITTTFTGASPNMYRGISAVEVSGIPTSGSQLAHLETIVANPGTGTDAISSGTLSWSGSHDGIIIAFCGTFNSGVAATAGTGCTDNGSVQSTSVPMRVASKTFTGATSASITFTAPSAGTENWTLLVIVLGTPASGQTVSIACQALAAANAYAGIVAAASIAAKAASASKASSSITAAVSLAGYGCSASEAYAPVSSGVQVAVAATAIASCVAYGSGNSQVSIAGKSCAYGAANAAVKAAQLIAAQSLLASEAWGSSAPVSPFPIAVSANGRYFVDAQGKPWRMLADAVWLMPSRASIADVRTYLNTRVSQGYNAIIVQSIEPAGGYSGAINAPANLANIQPFSTPGHIDTPVDEFWDFLGQICDEALNRRVAVILCEFYLGFNGGSQGLESMLADSYNTQARCFAFGAYLGTRLGDRANIIWLNFGDHDPGVGTETTFRMRQIIRGIRSTSPSQISSGLLGPYDSLTTDETTFSSGQSTSYDTNFNFAYGYGPGNNGFVWTTANQVWSYVANDGKRLPGIIGEPKYEDENGTTPESLRAAFWWGALEGCISGSAYGRAGVWDWQSNALTLLASASAAAIGRAHQMLSALSWHVLLPSGTAAGYVGRDLVASGQTSDSGHIPASRASDGTILVAYVPSTGTGTRTFGVDLRGMLDACRAAWWNPITGALVDISGGGYVFSNTASNQSFTTPGDNGSGANDWGLLVFSRLDISILCYAAAAASAVGIPSAALSLTMFASCASAAKEPPAPSVSLTMGAVCPSGASGIPTPAVSILGTALQASEANGAPSNSVVIPVSAASPSCASSLVSISVTLPARSAAASAAWGIPTAGGELLCRGWSVAASAAWAAPNASVSALGFGCGASASNASGLSDVSLAVKSVGATAGNSQPTMSVELAAQASSGSAAQISPVSSVSLAVFGALASEAWGVVAATTDLVVKGAAVSATAAYAPGVADVSVVGVATSSSDGFAVPTASVEVVAQAAQMQCANASPLCDVEIEGWASCDSTAWLASGSSNPHFDPILRSRLWRVSPIPSRKISI